MYSVKISLSLLSTIKYRLSQWYKEWSKAIIPPFSPMDRQVQEKRIQFKEEIKAKQKELFPKLSKIYSGSLMINPPQTKATKSSFHSYKYTTKQYTT